MEETEAAGRPLEQVPGQVAEGGPAGRWKALFWLSAVLVLSMTTWFSASAVIPQLRDSLALGQGTAAWLTIGVQLGFVAGAVFSAALNLADVLSARHLILGGSLGAATANLLVSVAGVAWVAIVLRGLTGFFLAAVYPPALKLISTWFRRGRGLALGILVGAIALGSAGPHLINGLGGLDWKIVIYVTTANTVLGGVLVLTMVREGPYPFPRAVFDPRQTAVVLKDRGVLLASLGYFGHMWELFAMWGWYAVFFGASLEAAGRSTGSFAAYATFAVIGVGGLGCVVGGVLADRWGRTQTTILMLAVSGACSLTVGLLFGGSPWLLLAFSLVWGFAIVADSAQFSTMVTELADQAYVGTALTLQLATGFALTVVTIRLIPYLENAWGWHWAFTILAAGPALGILAIARLRSIPEARALIGGGKG
jgi:MFS family permease